MSIIFCQDVLCKLFRFVWSRTLVRRKLLYISAIINYRLSRNKRLSKNQRRNILQQTLITIETIVWQGTDVGECAEYLFINHGTYDIPRCHTSADDISPGLLARFIRYTAQSRCRIDLDGGVNYLQDWQLCQPQCNSRRVCSHISLTYDFFTYNSPSE